MADMQKDAPSPDSVSEEKQRIQDFTHDPEKAPSLVGSRGSKAGSLTGSKHSRRSSLVGRLDRLEDAKHQDPFIGDETGEVHYRSMEWWMAATLMSAETLSTGILSLPAAYNKLGLATAIPVTFLIAFLNWYTGYVIWQMRNRFPFIHTFADAGEVLFAPLGVPSFGRELFGVMQTLVFTLQAAAHVNLWTNCLTVLSNHDVCTVVWSVIGLIVLIIFGLPRTLRGVSILSIFSLISIFATLVIVMAAVGANPPVGHGPQRAEPLPGVPFYRAFIATANIQFAFSGHCAIFNIISELKRPDHFPRANAAFGIITLIACTVFGAVTYHFAGVKSVSPAMNIPTEKLSKAAWGVAIPTIVIAGVIYGHCAVKYIYVRIFRGTPHLHSNSFFSLGVWFGISLCCWLFSWVIAESIPVFSDLLAFVSSLVATWFTFGFPAMFWFFLNWGQYFRTSRKAGLFGLNVIVMLVALTYCVAGFYSSGKAIQVDTAGGAHVWSC